MFRKLIAIAAFAGVALVLSACGSYGPTPYQPSSKYEGGYSETKIENDRYRISFKGNSMTGKETVENYMLYRAAELTIQNGYDTFTIANRDTDKQSRTREYGGFLQSRLSYAYFVPRVGWVYDYDTFWTPSRYEQVTRYDAFAEVVLGKGPKSSDPNAFDARQVEHNLAPTIQRPTE
jgi:hypothetical protein